MGSTVPISQIGKLRLPTVKRLTLGIQLIGAAKTLPPCSPSSSLGLAVLCEIPACIGFPAEEEPRNKDAPGGRPRGEVPQGLPVSCLWKSEELVLGLPRSPLAHVRQAAGCRQQGERAGAYWVVPRVNSCRVIHTELAPWSCCCRDHCRLD